MSKEKEAMRERIVHDLNEIKKSLQYIINIKLNMVPVIEENEELFEDTYDTDSEIIELNSQIIDLMDEVDLN